MKYYMPLANELQLPKPTLANQNQGKFLPWADWQVYIENKPGWN